MKSNLALQTARDFVTVCILLIVAVRGRCLGVVAVGEYLSFCKASIIQADVAVAACHMPIQQIAAECVGVHIVQVMRETRGAVESTSPARTQPLLPLAETLYQLCFVLESR